MGKIRDKIDHFLFRFSYSFKIKSVIYLTIGAAIFIAIMLIVSQHHLNVSTRNQKEGMIYLKTVNELYESVILFQIVHRIDFLAEETPQLSPMLLQKEVEIKLEALQQATKNLVEYWGADSPISIDLQKKIEGLNQSVISVLRDHNANEFQQDILFIRMEESIHNLIYTIRVVQDLDISIDPTVYKLLNIYSKLLPTAQREITFFLVSPEIRLPKIERPLEAEASIIVRRNILKTAAATIVANLSGLKNLNEVVTEALMDPLTQNHIATFTTSVDYLITLINYDVQPDLHEIADVGIPALNSSFFISNDVHQLTTTLLTQQGETLQWREYFGVSFLSFGIIMGLGAYTTRLIRRPLYVIRKAAEELARGNLSARIHVTVKDEVNDISEAFNQMVNQIEMIIHHTGAISDNLATLASNIFTTAKQLETNIVRQERAITQIASNAKGVSRTVQDFAKSLQEVSQTTTLTTNIANLGRSSLTDMEVIMLQMAKASMSIVKTLSDLQDKVSAINSVINAIVRIADQINLLSLNTAIRSEKPGTHHLGFSVVADKISELADQTALVTLDIEALVQSIIDMVSICVKTVDNFSDQIRNQVFEAAEIGEQLKLLISQTQNQFESFEVINQEMQLQALRASQIHEAINLLTETAQKTTQSIRNLYLEIEYLHHSTGNLRERTKKLTEEQPEEVYFSTQNL
jgi:methyl-accepting chemotaxis protein